MEMQQVVNWSSLRHQRRRHPQHITSQVSRVPSRIILREQVRWGGLLRNRTFISSSSQSKQPRYELFLYFCPNCLLVVACLIEGPSLCAGSLLLTSSSVGCANPTVRGECRSYSEAAALFYMVLPPGITVCPPTKTTATSLSNTTY